MSPYRPGSSAWRVRAGHPDANRDEIVRALRAVGCSVILLDGVGDGCPDLLVGRDGVTLLMEVKVPKGKLLESQAEAAASWRGGPWVVVRSADEALRAVGLLGP